MDRATNAGVGAAATEVPRHGVVDVIVGRLPGAGEQRGGAHDLPDLAITALGNVFFDPRALQRMRPVGRESLDRGDGARPHRTNRHRARAHDLAVEMHGARAAQSGPAAVLGTGEIEDVPKHPEERHIGWDVDFVAAAVDRECGGHTLVTSRSPTLCQDP